MKLKAMLPGSAPYWRNTSRLQWLPAAASTSRPCRTSCRAYAPRSLSTNKRGAFCHCSISTPRRENAHEQDQAGGYLGRFGDRDVLLDEFDLYGERSRS